MKNYKWRKSTQFLLEGNKELASKDSYDIYPTLKIEENQIFAGFNSLAKLIATKKNIIIDAYVGVILDDFQERLDAALREIGIKALWWHTTAALKNFDEIQALVDPFLGGDDPVFGKIATLSLSDFFEADKFEAIKPDPQAPLNILIGHGASLFNWNAELLYIDLPKNEIQFRARASSITNFGSAQHFDAKQTYKRFYFVDWVVFNKHKKDILSEIDFIIDGQNLKSPTWMNGENLRDSLKKLSQNIFRVRPWFEPGVWGGQWIKYKIKGLNQDVPNYAWSFELIVPENGLLFESSNCVLEVSFDCLMYQEYLAIMGKHADIYKYEFPIRFDFLDTFEGGNLSVQCHPQLEYMKTHFGENITQEETYYILDCESDAKVYLGFQDTINSDDFRKDLEWSAQHGKEIEISKHVKCLEAKKHDLFLIPPGTVHGSGINNLVLEISSTPYIYTFKMYDWARLDMDGKPRPINIERAMQNLDFDRKGAKVESELISKPELIEEKNDWKLYHLPTHANHLYDVHRYHFKSKISVITNNVCHVLNLVEGTTILVETENGFTQQFNYAETFVIPAAAKSCIITNLGIKEAILVKAFCK